MSNPYIEFCEIMKKASNNSPVYYIGEVIEGFPNLKVSTNNIVLEKENLLIDKWLLDRQNELSTEHDKINVGDMLILLPSEDRFIIISKVVAL